MKALDKNYRPKNKSKDQDHPRESSFPLLVDSPVHHHLLQPPPQFSGSFVNDLVNYKKKRSKKQRELTRMFYTVGLCISLLIVITAFEWKFYDKPSVIELGTISADVNELVDIPLTEQPPPPPPKVTQPDIVEVADEEVIQEEIEVDFDININEETKVEEVVIFEEAVDAAPEEEVADEIFTIVEQKPEPVGGMKAFYEYLGANLKYPDLARRMGIEGYVYVQFVVEKDGSLTDIQVMRGIGAGCDEEALRVLKNAPKWQPGKQRGQPVRVRNFMPILFRLYRS